MGEESKSFFSFSMENLNQYFLICSKWTRPSSFHETTRRAYICQLSKSAFYFEVATTIKQFLVSSSIIEEFITRRRRTCRSGRSRPFCFPVYGHYLCSCGFHSSKSVLGLEVCTVHSSLISVWVSILVTLFFQLSSA